MILRGLHEARGDELERLLSAEIAARYSRFRSDYGAMAQYILSASKAGRLPGILVGPPGDAAGYGFVWAEMGRAGIGGVWLRKEASEAAGRVARALVQEAKCLSRGGRVEVQDMGFGEISFKTALQQAGCISRSRVFMEVPLGAHFSETALPGGYSSRPLQAGDLLQISSIAHRAFNGSVDSEIDSSYGSSLSVLKMLTAVMEGLSYGPVIPRASQVISDESGRLVGFVLVSKFGPASAHVVLVAVGPETEGRGLGRWLVESAARQSASAGLDYLSLYVTEENTRARHLYRHLGFTERYHFHAYVSG